MSEQNKQIREPVQWFAGLMEETLQRNDHKGGWEECTPVYLYERLREEIKELGMCSPDQVINEATDVANFAMMIADNARRMLGGKVYE